MTMRSETGHIAKLNPYSPGRPYWEVLYADKRYTCNLVVILWRNRNLYDLTKIAGFRIIKWRE
jgi:hypothetical protein